MIDELTGLPTTRTGRPQRREGVLGPGAELGVRCAKIEQQLDCPSEDCFGGWWDIWHDLGTDEIVFLHHHIEWQPDPNGAMTGRHRWWHRKFAAFHVRKTKEWGGTVAGCLAHLVRHEVHPVNQPTPGKTRKR